MAQYIQDNEDATVQNEMRDGEEYAKVRMLATSRLLISLDMRIMPHATHQMMRHEASYKIEPW